MERLRSVWDVTLGEHLSIMRLVGFASDRLWVLMMFYSIVPYLISSDIRGSLYTNLFISLAAMVITLLFASLVVKRGDRMSANRLIVGGAAIMTAIGTSLTLFSDPLTTSGMLILGIAAVTTGAGSSVLFLCWMESFSDTGGRLALVELSLASCIAFVVAFVLIIVPFVISDVVLCLAPIASAVILWRCQSNDERLVKEPDQPMSRQTVVLFVKALLGAALIGVIQGFYDVVSGFRFYQVEDVYGAYLFLGGFLAVLVMALIAVFLHRDGVFFTYRFSMLMLCLGCLLTPFMADSSTYSNAFIFGGYNCFAIVLCVVCIDVATSFKVGATRAVGLGFVALYGGEVVGSAAAHSFDLLGLPLPDLTVVTLLAVSVLFVSHLFLFTETDLVKIGIGEVNLVVHAKETVRQEATDEMLIDPCTLIAKRFGLSPRESDVLPLLLEGRTIVRIQEALFISAGTVSTHIRHIYQKTGVDNRQELIDLAKGLRAGDEETL